MARNKSLSSSQSGFLPQANRTSSASLQLSQIAVPAHLRRPPLPSSSQTSVSLSPPSHQQGKLASLNLTPGLRWSHSNPQTEAARFLKTGLEGCPTSAHSSAGAIASHSYSQEGKRSPAIRDVQEEGSGRHLSFFNVYPCRQFRHLDLFWLTQLGILSYPFPLALFRVLHCANCRSYQLCHYSSETIAATRVCRQS